MIKVLLPASLPGDSSTGISFNGSIIFGKILQLTLNILKY